MAGRIALISLILAAGLPLQTAYAVDGAGTPSALAKPEITVVPLKKLDEVLAGCRKLNQLADFSDDGSSYAFIEEKGLKAKAVNLNGVDGPEFSQIHLGLPTQTILPDAAPRGSSTPVKDEQITFSSDGQRVAYVGYELEKNNRQFAVIQSATKTEKYPLNRQESTANQAALAEEWCFVAASPDLSQVVLFNPIQRVVRVGASEFRYPAVSDKVKYESAAFTREGAFYEAPKVAFSRNSRHYSITYDGSTELMLVVDGLDLRFPAGTDVTTHGIVFMDGPCRFAKICGNIDSQPHKRLNTNAVLVRGNEKNLPVADPDDFAISNDGAHWARVVQAHGSNELWLDDQRVAVYPRITKPTFAGDGTLACVVSGNGKSAVWVAG